MGNFVTVPKKNQSLHPYGIISRAAESPSIFLPLDNNEGIFYHQCLDGEFRPYMV